ncbi:MAG: 2,3-bisphosphoglycerate-dependent phosphoglycerate mutase [Nitrosomonas sp.]|nr:2,3-bisphosphoglycerate-dependent phosphoglycerate mutase [Nitrosomonas sp.]
MAVLALIRHGQSLWTRDNRFSGWADISLSPQGREEARRAGRALAASNIKFDLCQTSLLSRASETLQLIKAEMQTPDLNTETSWLLNERHYGSLQGQSRREVYLRYGNKQVAAWRRDYRARPPLQEINNPNHPYLDPKYQHVDKAELPSSESLEDAAIRVSRWWEKSIAPQLQLNQNMLIVAHTASLRGIVRILEQLDDTQTADFRIATCLPVIYEIEQDLSISKKYKLPVGGQGWLRQLGSKLKPTKLIPWI